MMAVDGASLLRASNLATAITFVAADDRAGRAAANADRDDDDVACGWSSAVLERGFALRRRGGSGAAAAAASCSRSRGGLVLVHAAGGEDRGCRREEAAAPGALGVIGAEAAVAKKPVMVDPVAFLCLAVL
ncbi:unnamed protein product [Urochloa decumbens]|uniref:Uncharacterized protein n=1 Tax=Urochloa decumbens TaxID=240449 RepID=A0ABC8X0W4_9POAL